LRLLLFVLDGEQHRGDVGEQETGGLSISSRAGTQARHIGSEVKEKMTRAPPHNEGRSSVFSVSSRHETEWFAILNRPDGQNTDTLLFLKMETVAETLCFPAGERLLPRIGISRSYQEDLWSRMIVCRGI